MSKALITHVYRQRGSMKKLSEPFVNGHHRCFSKGVFNNVDGVGGTITQQGTEARNKGTLQYQQTLPKQPIPSLEDTMSRYLERSLPYLSPEQQKTTKQVVSEFLKGDGPILHQKLLDYDNTKTNYVENFYRELYSGADYSSHSLNPNFVLYQQPGDTSAPATSTRLVKSILAHFVACKDGSFPPSVTKGKAIDMRQLPWIHASARIATPGKPDELVCHIDKAEQHMVVMIRGHFYKVPLVKQVSGEYHVVDAAALEAHLDLLMKDASQRPEGAYIGSLTCGVRPPWEAARTRLESGGNAQTLADIDEALLVLCIDDSDACVNLSGEGMELNVMYGVDKTSCANRWMDKWNIIVTKDGQAGMNWEHSLLDGHTMMEFFSPVGAGVTDFGSPLDQSKVLDIKEYTDVIEPLPWVNLDVETEKAVQEATDATMAKLSSVGVETLEFEDYGGSMIKSSKCSPDGYVQVAMFLAFYNLRQRLPVPYESVLSKSFANGRVTVARNMNQNIADWLVGFNNLSIDEQEECFRNIMGEIGRICREAASANEIDRPILAYRSLMKQEQLSIPFLEDDSWKKLCALDLCTSHCGKPPIRFFGYEPASADGYSVGYYVDNERMQFSINHFDKQSAKDYKQALNETLKMLPSIFKA